MSRPGLIAVKRMVSRGGRTFEQTVWIKPEDAKHVQSHPVLVPDWKLSHPDHVDQVSKLIHKTKDVSERKVLKHHFLEHIKDTHKVDWKEDKGDKAEEVNWMRGLMAIKKHLKNNAGATQPSQPAQPSTPTPAPSQPSTPTLGKNSHNIDLDKIKIGDKVLGYDPIRNTYGGNVTSIVHSNGGVTFHYKDGNGNTGTVIGSSVINHKTPAPSGTPNAPAPTKTPKNPPPAPTPQPTGGTPKVVLGTGQPMDKDSAKKAISDLRNKIGTEEMIKLGEANGIQWAKNPNNIANSYMQLAMKLSKHLQNGGVIHENGTGATPATPSPTPVVRTPIKASTPTATASAPKIVNPANLKVGDSIRGTLNGRKVEGQIIHIGATHINIKQNRVEYTVNKKDISEHIEAQPDLPALGSIEHLYHNASDRAKHIALVTGILPENKEAEDYLDGLIRDGKFDLNGKKFGNQPAGSLLTKNLQYGANRVAGEWEDNPQNVWGYGYVGTDSDKMFQGHPEEPEYLKYKEAIQKMDNAYGSDVARAGVQELNCQKQTIEAIKEITGRSDFGILNEAEASKHVGDWLHDLASDPNKAKEAWDKFNVGETYYDSIVRNSVTNPLSQILRLGNSKIDSWDLNHEVGRVIRTQLSGVSNTQDLINQVNAGTRDPMIFFHVVSQYFKGVTTNPTKNFMADLDSSWGGIGHVEFIRKFNRDKYGRDMTKFNADDFLDLANKAMKDFEPLSTDNADWIRKNLHMMREIGRTTGNNGMKAIEDWEPMPKTQYYDKSKSTREKVEYHIWMMKKSIKGREDQRKKEAKANQAGQSATPIKKRKTVADYIAEYAKGTSHSAIEYPSFKGIGDKIKASIEPVDGDEKAKVIANVAKTHDNANHSSFKTKVNGVYRIKNLPIEEKFAEIDKARNNTGFYYHGTGYTASQKIIGASGHYRVPKTRSDVKAGLMLGAGVYLATQSSKSMQYASDDYGRGIGARGILFVNKASLGNVKASTIRSEMHNRQLLNNDPNVDTLMMDKPHVLNPEWCVKEENAVIPRLWLDVVRERP